MHLDEEQIQRLVHGEVEPRAEADVRGHLADCAECRLRVTVSESEEEEVRALLRHLDHDPPHLDARDIPRQARVRETGWMKWAAGIALALGLGGASYAIPGSPVPAWVQAAVGWVAGRSHDLKLPEPTVPLPEPPPAPKADSSFAGIAVAPGKDLVISFTSSRGQLRVSLDDGAEVVVRAPAGAAVFTSHAHRLVIDNEGAAVTFDIVIPRAAPRVEIRVGDLQLFLKEGLKITTQAPSEHAGPYLLPLASQLR